MLPVAASSAVSQFGQIQEASRSGAPGSASTLGKSDSKGGFADMIGSFVEQTNMDQVASDSAIQDFATGKTDNIQQVVLAMANADMSFQLFMEIRNHLIDSYNELMRMQF
jgi:flagellar hook-basal body complex protein FliE